MKPVDFSSFRKRILIQVNEPQGDGRGGGKPNWVDLVNTSASIKPMTGREVYAWGQVLGEVSHVVQIRYRPGIVPQMRVVYHDAIYDIQSVIDVEEEHRLLTLGCTERVGLTNA
jgi:SPP1 family predicted phage head-tail adaptor